MNLNISGNGLAGLKVMVIDDSKTIRRTAETLLKKEGCDVLTAVDGFTYEQLFAGVDADGREVSRQPAIQKRLRDVREDLAGELVRAARAELHVRFAYSSSCLLMVMLGAALGLMFRGGQFLTAFATAAVPGAVVIVMLLMGKGIVKKVGGDLGLLAIWGGIAFLAVATCVVYVHLARR